MVKNSGQKNRAKQYATARGVTYQQAREALEEQHVQDELVALVAECGSAPLPPGQAPTRIPLGPDREGRMQWSDDEHGPVYPVDFAGGLTELIGGTGTGKTTMLNRIVAHLATEDPRPQSIVLFAGDREVQQARKRWASWPQVMVVGRNPVSPDGRDRLWRVTHPHAPAPTDRMLLSEEWVLVPTPEGAPAETTLLVRDDFMNEPIMNDRTGRQTFVFDDWFTEADGTLLRFTEESLDNAPRLSPAGWADWRSKLAYDARISGHAVIAAFRPGHTSQDDDSGKIRDAIRFNRGYLGGFIPYDAFVGNHPFDPSMQVTFHPSPAEVTLLPADDAACVWDQHLDARRFRPSRGWPLILGKDQDGHLSESEGEFVHALALRERLNPDGVPRLGDPYSHPYMEAKPLPLDATDAEVEDATDRALRDYWSIGERGPKSDSDAEATMNRWKD